MKIFEEDTSRLRVIPLGITLPENKEISMRYPEKDGQAISDVILIAGTPGSGKSVTGKLIAKGMAERRPVYCLDWVGRDWYLAYYPNLEGEHIPLNMRKEGLKGRYIYYPVAGSREKKEFEDIVRPNFTKYELGHYIRLGISPSAAMYLINIFERYGPFKDFETLVEFIEYFPLNEARANYMNKIKDKIHIKHNKFYLPTDKLPQQCKDNLTKILPLLLRMDIFRMDNEEELDYKTLFYSKKNLIASYNDLKIAKVEIDYLFSKLDKYRTAHEEGCRPFIFIEEAHDIFQDSGIEHFVLVCRKLSIGLCIIMPEVITLTSTVLDNIKNKIVFKMKGKNAGIMINSIGTNNAFFIPNLKLNRFTGEREFVYHNEDYGITFIVNQPYESPCGIHRETRPRIVKEDEF